MNGGESILAYIPCLSVYYLPGLLVPCAFAVDIISAIEFDGTGDHLATGDRGGRVVLFERTDARDVSLLTASHYTFFSPPPPNGLSLIVCIT